MCGILGYFGGSINESEFTLALNKIRHRGPDNRSIKKIDHHGSSYFGHARLSIVDLSDSANQPFVSSDGNLILIFNGEIYNHPKLREFYSKMGYRFATKSDTEVILAGFALEGPKVFSRLDGMFAIAIFNRSENSVYLARDYIGEKPLYYTFANDGLFAFASEPSALNCFDAVRNVTSIDYTSMAQVLTFGFIPGKFTAYNKIKKFQPGTYSKITIGRNQFDYVYQIDKNFTGERHSQSLIEVIDDSVKKRISADVPITMLFSGGIDSSVIYATLLKYDSRIESFSLSSPSSKDNEIIYAQKIAASLGAKVNTIEFSDEEFEHYAIEYIETCDEPIADAAIIPLMKICSTLKSNYKVALTGDGGDEIFGGYIKYKYQELIEITPRIIRKLIGSLYDISNNENVKRIGQCIELDLIKRQFHFGSGGLLPNDLNELKSDGLNLDIDIYRFCSSYQISHSETPYINSKMLDLHYQLPDWYLYKADRASMLYGVELRAPFLSRNVIDFAFDKDNRIKKGKEDLKTYLRQILPNDLVDRPKRGFTVALDKFVNSKYSQYVIGNHIKSDYFDLNQVYFNKLTNLQKFKVLCVKRFLQRNE